MATIDDAVKQFRETLDKYRIFAFSGDLGAGKTTFIHHLCDLLQVEDAVSSPTFALINEYHFRGDGGTDNIIYHLDWYRLRDAAEAINAGMEDCIDTAHRGKAWCFIEWPGRALELLKTPWLQISIQSTDELSRVMTIEEVS